MRALLQRVRCADVTIDGENAGKIGAGLLVLLGVGERDTEAECDYLLAKALELRIFEDEAGKMNRCLLDVGGELLVVSQFTLYADCKRGRRPAFVSAARPETAIPLYERFLRLARERGVTVQSGRFGAEMQVGLVNDGPVTILLDSDELMPRGKE